MKHSPAQLVGEPGDRGHDVVGLEALVGQQGNAQGLDHAMHEVDLRHKVLVHVGPAGLVLLVKLVAKCLARQVEGAEEEVGLFRFQQIEQVPGKAIDGIDRLAAGAGHVREWRGKPGGSRSGRRPPRPFARPGFRAEKTAFPAVG